MRRLRRRWFIARVAENTLSALARARQRLGRIHIVIFVALLRRSCLLYIRLHHPSSSQQRTKFLGSPQRVPRKRKSSPIVPPCGNQRDALVRRALRVSRTMHVKSENVREERETVRRLNKAQHECAREIRWGRDHIVVMIANHREHVVLRCRSLG